jgi:hypothetical protein
MPIRRAFLAVLAAALAAAPTAFAGSPGKWSQLGQANLGNIDEAALARTADGTLHVVWTIPAPNNDTLVHDAVGPNGVVAPPNVITTGWATIDPVPDVLATSTGLRVLFGGIRTTNSTEPNQYMNTATAPPSGASWDLQIGSVVTGDAAYGSDVGAALLPDGTPLFAFGGTGSGVFSHRGLDPSTPDFQLQSQLGGCCGYSPDVAVDQKSGAAFAVWISNATNNIGVFAQSLDPSTGAPAGAPAKMPHSSTVFNGVDSMNQQLQRVPVAARAEGGVYAVYPGDYPTTRRVFLWRIADSKSSVVGFSNFDHVANIAADPLGRLWAVWAERSSPPQVFARRSNLAATRFGPAVKVAIPKGQQSVFKIAGNAQSGPLDVIALLGSSTGTQAQWHTQILPALDLSASPAKINGAKTTAVKFSVSDPDPVKGAKVSAGGKSATTDAKGRATIDLGPTKAKSIKATAKKAGYTSAAEKLKVK